MNISDLAFWVKLSGICFVLSFHFLRYSRNPVNHWKLPFRNRTIPIIKTIIIIVFKIVANTKDDN